MSTAVMTGQFEMSSVANKSLRAAAGFWFVRRGTADPTNSDL